MNVELPCEIHELIWFRKRYADPNVFAKNLRTTWAVIQAYEAGEPAPTDWWAAYAFELLRHLATLNDKIDRHSKRVAEVHRELIEPDL